MHKSLFTPFTRGLLAGAILITAAGLAAAQSAKSFRPGEVSRDTNGQPIRAHDGGFYFENGVYYLVKSACSGFGHNDDDYAIADTMMGKWKNVKKIAEGPKSASTFQSQVTFVLRVEHGGYKDRPAFIFVADRWNERRLDDSRLLFLPVTVLGKGEISVEWHDEWDLSLFDAQTKQ